MISDVLCEAISSINQYLTDPAFAGAYTGEIRGEIMAARTLMKRVLRKLDKAPGAKVIPKGPGARAENTVDETLTELEGFMTRFKVGPSELVLFAGLIEKRAELIRHSRLANRDA